MAIIIYFLAQTCRTLQINPYGYFDDILRKIQSYPYKRLQDLLPQLEEDLISDIFSSAILLICPHLHAVTMLNKG